MPCFYIFLFAFLTFCFPPSFPQMFWWLSRTNETYAFLPRVSWVGTSRVSGRRFWGSWKTLHAALETRARQYWCAFITFVYTLPVSKAGQVGDVGVPSGDCCLWMLSLKMILKYLNLKCFQWVSPKPPTHICCLVHLWRAQLPVFLPLFVVVVVVVMVMLSVWVGTFSRFFHLSLPLNSVQVINILSINNMWASSLTFLRRVILRDRILTNNGVCAVVSGAYVILVAKTVIALCYATFSKSVQLIKRGRVSVLILLINCHSGLCRHFKDVRHSVLPTNGKWDSHP